MCATTSSPAKTSPTWMTPRTGANVVRQEGRTRIHGTTVPAQRRCSPTPSGATAARARCLCGAGVPQVKVPATTTPSSAKALYSIPTVSGDTFAPVPTVSWPSSITAASWSRPTRATTRWPQHRPRRPARGQDRLRACGTWPAYRHRRRHGPNVGIYAERLLEHDCPGPGCGRCIGYWGWSNATAPSRSTRPAHGPGSRCRLGRQDRGHAGEGHRERRRRPHRAPRPGWPPPGSPATPRIPPQPPDRPLVTVIDGGATRAAGGAVVTKPTNDAPHRPGLR